MALTDNIVSYYKMEGNSNDAAGTNNGTDTSVTYGNSFGKIGQGASFGGAASYTTVADAASLDFTGALSLCGWINPQSFTVVNYLAVKTLSGTWSSGNGAQWYARIDTSTAVEMGVNIGGVIKAFAPTVSAMSTGTWYFLCGTYDGTTMTLYLNGASVGTSTAASGAMSTGAFSLYLGNNNLSGEFNAHYVDELGIWSRALSSTEISQLYNSGAGLQYPFTSATVARFMLPLLGVG